MDSSAQHIWLLGGRAADRARELTSIGTGSSAVRETTGPETTGPDISVQCHRRLRGPYSGTCQVLRAVTSEAFLSWPELVDEHRTCILYATPALSDDIGPALPILTFSTPHDERTRFFGLGYVRAVSHGLVTFLCECARRRQEAQQQSRPLVVFFDSIHAADPVEQEFLELLLRRSDPRILRVIVGSADEELPAGLEHALTTYARRIPVAQAPPGPLASDDDNVLARDYIWSDGASDDPRLLAAYEGCDFGWRAVLHDERANELEASGDWDLRLGAIPYHREKGTDPSGAGAMALKFALEHCLAMGFYASLYDLGLRGRDVVDPISQQQEFCHFTAKAASALVAFGRPGEAERLFHELREIYTLPRVHMSTSYNLAMLYTRWYGQRNHDLAKGYCNNAIALAVQEQDPELQAFYTVFQRNGLALVEMHRGDLEMALDLVTTGLRRLDKELPENKYLVHREQLLHNRARVLVAMGRLDEAIEDFSKLLVKDPYYTEYYIDRGNTRRKNGDELGALADYDRACNLGIPFPEVYYNRGDVRVAQGDIAGAISDFGYVLEMEPDYLDARISHAELLIDLDQLGAAAATLAEGLVLHPDSAALHALHGLVALLTGDAGTASASLDRALALDPELPAAHAHRGVLAADTGDDELAIAHLTSALTALDGEAGLRYRRALSYLALGNRQEAERDLRAVIMAADEEYLEDARTRLAELSVPGGAVA